MHARLKIKAVLHATKSITVYGSDGKPMARVSEVTGELIFLVDFPFLNGI